jgi:hypothetical protein
MKQIKLAIAMLIFLLASMVIVPFVNAAPDIVASANTNHDANLVSVDQATSVATQFVNAISSSNPKFADWKGAFVKKETTYYDLAGKYSAYSFDVLVNGQYDGYIIISATRENYPVLEFSKGKTPNSDITTQNTVKSLATTTAVSRQVTLGEGKPIYLGGSFYFMQYPIQKTGISKTKVQSTQDTLLVDMTEERVVSQDSAIKTASLSISSANQANIGLDEKNISQNMNHRKQDAQAAWNALDKMTDTALSVKSESVAASASYNYQKTVSDVPIFYWEHGCSPTSSAMVLGYWRNLGLTRLPDDDGINTTTLLPNGDPLNQALATEMGTSSFLGQDGWTWPWMIAHGIGRVINIAGYPYISSSAVDTLLSWPMIQSEIDANRPFVLSVFSINFSTLSFWGHSYAVVGYGYDSWLSTKYIEVYTTWPDDPHKYITFFSWDGAMNTYVRPDYTYSITSSAGSNGQIDPVGIINAPVGTNKTYTITPASGYIVDEILVDNQKVTLNPYSFEDITSDHTISVTFTPSICSMLTFTDANFRSDAVQYFNSNTTIPAGNYTLNVTGWNSQWSYDMGWWEEGVTTQASKSAVWNNMTNLWVEGETTPLSTIVTGEFARENSWGSALVNISSPSRVGIVLVDNPYYDNRGAATFVLRNAGQTCPATVMKQSVNVLPSIAIGENGMIMNETIVETINKS